MKSHTAQDLLVDLVLKSPLQNAELVDSVLVNAVGKGTPPSQVK